MRVHAPLVSGNENVLQAGRSGGHGQDDEQQSRVVLSSMKKPRLLQLRPDTNNILPSFKVLPFTSPVNWLSISTCIIVTSSYSQENVLPFLVTHLLFLPLCIYWPLIRCCSCVVLFYQVRKEKLGNRIAALQQLVFPFGKVSNWRVTRLINMLNFN